MIEDSQEFRHSYVVMEKILAAEASNSLYMQLQKITREGEHRGDDFGSSVRWLINTDEIQVCHICLLSIFFS